MRLNVRRVRVRSRDRDAREVRFRTVGKPVVTRWYMTDDERLEESRRIDGVERVGMGELGLSAPGRRGENRGRLARVGIVAVRWLRG